MIKNLVKLAFVAAVGLQIGSASATNVAYLGCASTGNYLNSYGFTVTQIDTCSGTPGSLAGYDAVVVSSNGIPANSTALGNLVKSFADAGGGVVLTEFSFQGVWQIGGGITGAGYSPFTNDPSSNNYANPGQHLGTVYDPVSFLFAGVNIANVMNDYQANVGMDAGATLVADWANGRHAIGYNSLAGSSVVGLNMFVADGYGNQDTNRLVANAINFSLTNHSNVAEPSALALSGLALLALGASRRRKAA